MGPDRPERPPGRRRPWAAPAIQPDRPCGTRWSRPDCLFPLCCPGAPEEWLRHRSCRHASLRTDRVGKTGRPFGNVARAKTNDHVAGFKLLAELFRQIVRILYRRGGMLAARTEARRVGKGGVSTCRYRGLS